MKNLVSLSFSNEDLAALDEALDVIETKLVGLVSLTSSQVRGLAKVRGVLSQRAAGTGPEPAGGHPGLGPARGQCRLGGAGLAAAALRRLRLLASRGEDTQFALGADVMSAALEDYALLKVSGRASGLEDQRRELGSRFYRASRRAEEEDEAVAPA